MFNKRIRLSLPANCENLALIRQFASTFIEGTPYRSRSYEIQLVLSEACTNVIRHAYDDEQASRLITLSGSMSFFTLQFSVSDTGNGLVGQGRQREFPGDGGYGLPLMKELCDDFSLDALPGIGTTVNILFKRPFLPLALPAFLRSFVVPWKRAAGALQTGLSDVATSIGSYTYSIRARIERCILRLPLDSSTRLDLALYFADRHLDAYERLGRKGKMRSRARSVMEATDAIKTICKEYRSADQLKRGDFRGEIRELSGRLLTIAESDQLGSNEHPLGDEGRSQKPLVEAAVLAGQVLCKEPTNGSQPQKDGS